jgi:hypothetical protein
MLKQPSAFLPVAMSLAALSIVLLYLARNGPSPQADEGTAAHLWQLLMAGQLPFIGYFVVKWLLQAPREALPMLGLQVLVALSAVAPVVLLKW